MDPQAQPAVPAATVVPTTSDFVTCQQVLDEWLDKMNAKTKFTKNVAGSQIEGYTINGTLVLVMRYQRGFDVFTSSDSIQIPTVFRDAERRVGLLERSTFPKIDVSDAPELERNIGLTLGDTTHMMTPDECEKFGMAALASSDRAREQG